jgi:hypothetical protein
MILELFPLQAPGTGPLGELLVCEKEAETKNVNATSEAENLSREAFIILNREVTGAVAIFAGGFMKFPKIFSSCKYTPYLNRRNNKMFRQNAYYIR